MAAFAAAAPAAQVVPPTPASQHSADDPILKAIFDFTLTIFLFVTSMLGSDDDGAAGSAGGAWQVPPQAQKKRGAFRR